MNENQTDLPKEDTTFESYWDDGSGKYYPVVFAPRFFYGADKQWGDAARAWAVAASESGEEWHVARGQRGRGPKSHFVLGLAKASAID